MNTNELKEMSISELRNELENLLREQFNLRMQRGTGQTPRPHLFANVRRNIARIKTIMAEKEKVGAKDE